MSSMRLFSREDWRTELQSRWNLTPTGHKTATTEIWLTPGGKAVSVPDLGDGPSYPDSLLNLIEDQLRAIGEHPFEGRSATGLGAEPAKRPGN
jgi:hypothetical protein